MSLFPDKLINEYLLAFTLTADFANSLAAITKNIDCTDFTEMTVYAFWTPGTIGDTLFYEAKFSSNNVVFNPEPDEVVAAGVGTILAKSRKYVSLLATPTVEAVPVFSIPISDRRAQVNFKETAAGAAGILTVNIRLSRLK